MQGARQLGVSDETIRAAVVASGGTIRPPRAPPSSCLTVGSLTSTPVSGGPARTTRRSAQPSGTDVATGAEVLILGGKVFASRGYFRLRFLFLLRVVGFRVGGRGLDILSGGKSPVIARSISGSGVGRVPS